MKSTAYRSAWSKLDVTRHARLRAYVARVGIGRAVDALGTTHNTLHTLLGGGAFLTRTVERFAAAIDDVTKETP